MFFADDLVLPDIWTGDATIPGVAEWITDAHAIKDHYDSTRRLFLDIAKRDGPFSILHHPLTPSSKSNIIYQQHVPTSNGTAAYSDVRLFLERLQVNMEELGIPVHLVVGDQQSFSRMVWLKRKEPTSYVSIVPFPGDFHTAVHILMAVHLLWWNALICWIVETTGFSDNSIVEEWSSVELYNRYRQFYEASIVGILTYLLEILPKELWDQYDLLLEMASGQNEGTNNEAPPFTFLMRF